ncbi:helix-turn-helix domain-containing protein [Hydrogenivirga sp.]
MVGERIRELRESKGLSVEEFAKRVGIPTVRLEEIESGRLQPCDATLVYISKLFDVSFRWLKEGKREVAEVA